MKNVNIRKATIKDKAQILKFCKNTWITTEKDQKDETRQEYIQIVYDRWVRRKSLLIAEIDHKPIAILNAVPIKDGGAWLEGLRVSPAYKRKGIGSLLTNYVLNNYKYVRLSIYEWNEPSKKLAKKLGAKLIDSYMFINLKRCKYKDGNCKFAKDPDKIFALTNYGKNAIFVDYSYFYPDLEIIEKLISKRSIIEDQNGFGQVLRYNEEASLVIDNAVKIENLVNFFCKKYKNKKKYLVLKSDIFYHNTEFLKNFKNIEKLNIYEIAK
jgi:RimJ/RimL family protein N-acetyltransferase